MNEETWEIVGAPMLLDNDGNAVFIYTPPSLHSTSISKADDPRHAAKLFKTAQMDTTGRWGAFHFTSHDNPYISTAALADITKDMTQLAYEQEILAEDKDEAPGALWHHEMIEKLRVAQAPPLVRVVVGVDPPGGSTECGIVVVGKGVDGHGYILADRSLRASPNEWANVVVAAYKEFKADRVVAESNYGGDMVESTLRNAEGGQRLSYKNVVATRGKAIRAEPIAALYERGLVNHVGLFPYLEDEMCNWSPGDPKSPNHVDAMVWAITELDIVVDMKVAYESLTKRTATYAGRGAY
jgi:phage terminase large subunit-like protein